jgi:hypothetical protein
MTDKDNIYDKNKYEFIFVFQSFCICVFNNLIIISSSDVINNRKKRKIKKIKGREDKRETRIEK